MRSTDVMRRRIADALALMADALDPTPPCRQPEGSDEALDRVISAVPAFRASRRLTAHVQAIQPADSAETLTACRIPTLALIENTETPANVRKASVQRARRFVIRRL